jgi:hypothetical protein
MPNERVFFAVVAGYSAIVLWFLACGDSLQALAGRLERHVRRSAQRRGRFALRWDRSRTAARALVSGRFGSRRYFVGALAGAAVAGLIAVVVLGTRDVGPRNTAESEVALPPRSADQATVHPPRAVPAPAVAAQAHSRGPARITRQRAKPPAAVHGASEKPTRFVSNVVRVSAPTTPAPSVSVSTRRDGPAPLPAPAESPLPTPLPAPSR